MKNCMEEKISLILAAKTKTDSMGVNAKRQKQVGTSPGLRFADSFGLVPNISKEASSHQNNKKPMRLNIAGGELARVGHRVG